jgi:hypothetical protein
MATDSVESVKSLVVSTYRQKNKEKLAEHRFTHQQWPTTQVQNMGHNGTQTVAQCHALQHIQPQVTL